MQSQQIRPYFLIIVLVGVLALTAGVLWPFLKPLALAAVFAVVLQGLYRRINTALGNWPSVSALATVLVSVLVILLPLSLVGALVGVEARSLYISLEEGSATNAIAEMLRSAEAGLGPLVPGLGDFIRDASNNLDVYTKEGLQWIAGHAGSIFAGASKLLLSLFIFFIALYYLLRDGKRVREVLIELSPLSDSEDAGVFARLERAVNATIKGSLTIALVQGVLTAVGFALFGVPSPILWGTVAALAALIPGVGTALVFLPAVAFLFFIGAATAGVGLLIWGVLAVGLIDNLLGPKLVGEGMKIHPLLVLLSVLGGLAFYGPSGIFLGPLTLSLLFALLTIYADISRAPDTL